MAKVSIIVPIYNTRNYLKKCIDSLLNQTEKDIEVILINDGSIEPVDDIINDYTDKRIKYISKTNSGIGATRNLGISKSTGKYLMFIDSDDYIREDCVSVMYQKAINDKCDIVMSNYYTDKNGVITSIRLNLFADTSLKDNPKVIYNMNLGPCNKIYNREMIINKNIKFEEKLKYEDAPFVCKAFLHANKIGTIKDCLSYYVIHENSQTTIRDNRIFDILEIAKIIINDFQKYDYLHDALTNVITMILSDYTIQQREITSKSDRNRFIKEAFNILNDLDPNWRKCEYLKKYSFSKRVIKCNAFLTKIYCDMYKRGTV